MDRPDATFPTRAKGGERDVLVDLIRRHDPRPALDRTVTPAAALATPDLRRRRRSANVHRYPRSCARSPVPNERHLAELRAVPARDHFPVIRLTPLVMALVGKGLWREARDELARAARHLT
jgi:hypothetical protein